MENYESRTANHNNMSIKIIITNENDEVIAKRETDNWEVAEQNLDSLRRQEENKKDDYKESNN